MHTIKICFGGSCQRNFAKESLARAEAVLGIKAGETTHDGKFRLEICGCLSQCDFAPNVLFLQGGSPLSAVMMDGKVETHMLPQRLEAKLKELQNS